MSRLVVRFFWLGLTLGTIGCDQVTKQIAATELSDGARRSFLHDAVRLQYTENAGAFLGLGANLPPTIRTQTLIAATTVLLVGVLFALRQPGLAVTHRLGLYLILAAGLSNLLDRLIRGRVIDFLNLGIGTLRTGIFNVADVALMVGVALAVLAHRSSAPVESPSPPLI